MRQLLVSFAHRSLALWLGMFLCGEVGAQTPTSVAELHDRWIELLREADGDIAVETFEKVIGLELLVTTHHADGAVARSTHVTRINGPTLRADAYSHPLGKFMSVSIEWTPGFFAVLTSRSCLDRSRLTEDLTGMDWKARSDVSGPFAAAFQRNDDLAAYGKSGEGKGRRCRLYYQSHYFDPTEIGKSRHTSIEEPDG